MDRLAVRQEQCDFSGLEARPTRRPRWRVPAGDLQTLLHQLLVERYGTQAALAKAIGITDSRLAKVLKGDSGGFNVRNCLRLAKVAKVSPSQILRATANKTNAEIADLIENLYGVSAQPALAGDATARDWQPELSTRAKTLLREFLEEVAPKKHARRRRKR